MICPKVQHKNTKNVENIQISSPTAALMPQLSITIKTEEITKEKYENKTKNR